MQPPFRQPKTRGTAGAYRRQPPAILVVALLWLTFACALPLYQVRAARRQAHQDLQRLLAAGQPDHAAFLAAFDRSNQHVDAAASGPCLVLACAVIFLVNQTFRLKRRCHLLAHELTPMASPSADSLPPSHGT